MAITKMTENENTQWSLPLKVESKAGVSKVLATKDTYVDKNIKVDITVDAVEFNDVDAGAISATVGCEDTTYITTNETPYSIDITADGHVNKSEISVKTAGFADTTDKITVEAADATTDSKTLYIKEGALEEKTAKSVSATANGGITIGQKQTTAPESGYSIKVTSTGSVGVKTSGWVDTVNNATIDEATEAYYAIAKMAVANSATAGTDYTEVEGPALISGDYLYINAGYTEPIKISLADLVPDEANVKAGTDGNSNLIYNTVKVYDKDGNLVTGTMGDATLSDITASNVKATISSVTVGEKKSGAYAVTGSGDISGNTAVAIATTGYATTSLNKAGTIEGTANLNATINAGELQVNTDTITVTPVIAKGTGSALSGDITTTQPTNAKYVEVSAAAIEASATLTATVKTAGYVKDETATGTVTGGSNASGTYYIPITAGSHSAAKEGDATVVKATVTQAIVSEATDGSDANLTAGILSSAPTSGDYITITTSATPTSGRVSQNVKCTSTEGYITADSKTVSVEETVAIDTITEAKKYIKIYDGSIL